MAFSNVVADTEVKALRVRPGDAAAQPAMSEAMERLERLKHRIAEELLAERRLREMERLQPKLEPLSLAPAHEARRQRQPTALHRTFHQLVQGLKLDSWVQRELESELDRKTLEMETLQMQNDRLREIIMLRQEASQRQEEMLQQELDRLRTVTRRAAPADLTTAMDELRHRDELLSEGILDHVRGQHRVDRLSFAATRRPVRRPGQCAAVRVR